MNHARYSYNILILVILFLFKIGVTMPCEGVFSTLQDQLMISMVRCQTRKHSDFTSCFDDKHRSRLSLATRVFTAADWPCGIWWIIFTRVKHLRNINGECRTFPFNLTVGSVQSL